MEESFYNVVICKNKQEKGDEQNWLRTTSNGSTAFLTLQIQYNVIHTCVAVNSPNK